MDVHEALDAWQAQYSGQPPVGFMLRFTHESVWTRIHYLRDTAEPATLEDDQRTASRFDAVASALFTGTTVLVLAIHLDPRHEDTADLKALGATPITPPASWVETLGSYLPDPSRAEFVGATLTWQRGCLDRLWLAVARDLIGRIAVFCPATGDAFCPYGGGADVFVWGSERRLKLDDRFRTWLPAARMPGSVAQRSAKQMVAERR
ncbi:MAG: hypothetical protein ABSB75_08220 [Candidatus Limnocylindrales bacterium]